MCAYQLKSIQNVIQVSEDMIFKGGFPNIPEYLKLPNCPLCNTEMTFFFQVAFPEKHIWYEKVMAVFHCTSCYDPYTHLTGHALWKERHIADFELDTKRKH